MLFVDNDVDARNILAASLERAGYRVMGAANVAEAKLHLNRIRLDLVLLDWGLPDESGSSFVRQLRRDTRTSNVPILFVGARSIENEIVTALESGADDYVAKPFSERELIARMRTVLRARSAETHDGLVEAGSVKLDPLTMVATVAGRKIHLGLTEFRLFHFFITHPDRVVSRATIIERIWGGRIHVEVRTIDVHVRRLRMALEPDSAMIETVRGEGYCFRPRSEKSSGVSC